MPLHGYTRMFERMLDHPNIKVLLNTRLPRGRASLIPHRELIYTGPVDEYFDYRFGKLPYRSLEFQFETLDTTGVQPAPVINYPNEHAYTRVTEFKYLTGRSTRRRRSSTSTRRAEGDPYYPVPRAGERRALRAVPGAGRRDARTCTSSAGWRPTSTTTWTRSSRRRWRSTRSSPACRAAKSRPDTGSTHVRPTPSRRGRVAETTIAQAAPHQAGRSPAPALRARRAARRPLRAQPAGCAAAPERAPALASAARRMGRLRRPSAEPDVPAAAGVQPAGRELRSGQPDRGPRPAAGTSRSSRTCSRRSPRPRTIRRR